MDFEYIRNRLKKVDMLPTFPNVVNEILGIIEDPMSSASDLAKHMDPSMIGEVMRIANSAYFGTRSFGRIATIEHAIAVIGYEHLSKIVLQMPFMRMVNQSDAAFDRDKFIRHSLICGAMSKAISSTMFMGNENEAYISGILHDVGVVVIYRYFRDEWNRINSLVVENRMPRIEAEKEVFSMDHGFLGATLLEMWNIPREITESVKFHHEPDKAEENMGNVVVTSLGNSFSKRIDLERDLVSFTDFVVAHKDFIEQLSSLGKDFSPSEEMRFYEKIYEALTGLNNYIEGIKNGKDDKSPGG